MSSETTTGKSKAMSLVPTKQELLGTGKDLGGIALGIIASHAVLNIAKKQNSLMVNGALAVGGFYGACKVKNPILRSLLLGVAAYGTIKSLGIATQAVTEPGATSGLSGVLPESVKSALRKYIPTLTGIEEVAGIAAIGDAGDDELNLDDAGMSDMPDSPAVEGLGEVALAA